jgi:hypothetical protein
MTDDEILELWRAEWKAAFTAANPGIEAPENADLIAMKVARRLAERFEAMMMKLFEHATPEQQQRMIDRIEQLLREAEAGVMIHGRLQ